MQTFLPFSDFEKSARVLDNKRLGKQRVEGMQILKAVMGEKRIDGKPYKGWVNHPATKMWKPYPEALKAYTNAMIKEWIFRGYKNNMVLYDIPKKFILPDWFGDETFHSSHRSNLLRKDFKFYSQYAWKEGPDLPYFWPMNDLK